MTVSFEGFPRLLNRSALKPGRWFVAAEGLRPILCFATDVVNPADPLALAFGAPRVELIEVVPTKISELTGPFGTVEDEIVFAPGIGDRSPLLVAPTKRAFRSGALLRLRSGDLGLGFAERPGGELLVVSLTTGERADGYDLVFERWTLALRRAGTETVIGHFKPPSAFADERRRL